MNQEQEETNLSDSGVDGKIQTIVEELEKVSDIDLEGATNSDIEILQK